MPTSHDAEQTLHYSRPKIMIVDLALEVVERLRAAGYNVLPGKLGRPYKVKKADGFAPVVVKASVPNYAEQDIVVIDLLPPDTADQPEAEKHTSLGELDWYAKVSTGVIDPRPRVMSYLRDDSDRTLQSGGVFVVFADSRLQQKSVLAHIERRYADEFQVRQDLEEDNWSILTVLSPKHLKVESDYGTEIKVTEGFGVFTNFLRRHIIGATFSATLHPLYPLTEKSGGPIFFPLATNKFGETVAGIIVPKEKPKGWVLILPQLEDKTNAVLDLIQTVLPEVIPQLFPEHEGGRWVHRDEYEHSSVLERKTAQLEIQRKANEDIAKLDKEIEVERERLGFLHGILTKT
jgi:hypothetical protein